MQRALVDHAARIKHDLGKYVAFQSRWLEEGAPPAVALEAIRADLLSTRRGPEGSVDALVLWSAFRRPLAGEELLEGAFEVDLTTMPAFRALDAAMIALAPFVERLRADEPVDAELACAAAKTVAGACTDLLASLRES